MDQALYQDYSELEKNYWWFVARRRILADFFQRYIQKKHGPQHILDIGAGTGAQRDIFGSSADVIGLEKETEALSLNTSHEHLVQANAECLPFVDRSFDVISGLDIIEHLEDDLTALEEMLRICKPGGHLLLTVPAFPFLWSHHDEMSHHKRRYLKRELRDLIQQSGWQIQRLTYFNTLLFPAITLLKVLSPRTRPQERSISDIRYPLPSWLNHLLERVFSAEKWWLRFANFTLGVSLLCVAKRS